VSLSALLTPILPGRPGDGWVIGHQRLVQALFLFMMRVAGHRRGDLTALDAVPMHAACVRGESRGLLDILLLGSPSARTVCIMKASPVSQSASERRPARGYI